MADISPDWSYITQINDFEMSMQYAPVSARARALWYRLMHYWNKAYWNQPLILTETTIRGDLNLTHGQFLNARKELKDEGYIIHKAQGGRKPGQYWIKILRPPESLIEKKQAKRRIWEDNFVMFTTNTQDDQPPESVRSQIKASLDEAASNPNNDAAFNEAIRNELRREAYGEERND